MTIYKFIEHAETLRNGGVMVIGCPPSYGRTKQKHVRHRKLENAYSALWGFRIKHPDSTRTARAKQLGKIRKVWNLANSFSEGSNL